MISFDEATSIVLEAVGEPKRKTVSLKNSFGFALSEDIVSALNVSPFRNSAMDGFAISSKLLEKCTKENSVTLPVLETIFAGGKIKKNYANGGAVKIMTGAEVPSVYDSVVKVEETSFINNEVTFYQPVRTGSNIRLPGEDIAIGEKLYSSGYLIKQFDQGILASIGLNQLSVFEKPRVLVVSTGNELIEPGNELESGEIFNSNTQTIISMISSFCKNIQTMSSVRDSEKSLNSILLSDHDIIITTGSVSMGDKDLLVKFAEKSGWERVFHKASLKPGKPIYVARKSDQLLFGLPGNPLSAAVTCAVFVIPVLKKFAGRKDYLLPFIPATLDVYSERKFSGRLIWPGKINNIDGQLIASYSDKKSSACLTALKDSDGLLFKKENSVDQRNLQKIEVVFWNQLFDNRSH